MNRVARTERGFPTRNLAYTLAVVLVLITFAACSRSIAGKYVSERGGNRYREFKSDGTVFSQEGAQAGYFTYEIDGDEIIVKSPSGRAVKCRVQDNKIIDPDGETWVKQ